MQFRKNLNEVGSFDDLDRIVKETEEVIKVENVQQHKVVRPLETIKEFDLSQEKIETMLLSKVEDKSQE